LLADAHRSHLLGCINKAVSLHVIFIGGFDKI
jgi:hypothetical protein